MQIHEFVDEGLGHSSYLIDLDGRTAAIVDPPRLPIAHEQLADELGVEIAWTIDTHSHADYVTGSPGLVARRGAVFVAPAASNFASPHRPVSDGEIIELAPRITLTALATPGHTPDHHAYVLAAHGRATALFSGGSLMVGTVGRTDLCGPDLAVPLAHEMFRGLRRFDTLPDTLAVSPTHGAGSFCSAPGASQRTSTLAHERDTNPLFSIRDEDTFVEQLVAGFGTFPTYFARLPEVNRLGPARYDSPRSHPTMSNTLRPVFASWLGWLVEHDQRLVFILENDQDRADLVRQCLDVGHEHLVGEFAGGIDAWTGSGRPVASIPFVDVNDMTGASVLAARGHHDVVVFDGGPDSWSSATGRPLAVAE